MSDKQKQDQQQKQKQDKKSAGKGALLHIRSRGPRRRRAGIGFTRAGAVFRPSELKGKLKEIQADPKLVITEVNDED